MSETKYRLPSTGALTIPAEDAEKLLSLHSGECALLYIHILSTGGVLDPDRAVRELDMPPASVSGAAEALRRAGLLRAEEGRPMPPAEELPEYTAQDILRRSREDPAFQALVAEAQRVLGHALSGADLKTLFGIYDRLGMPSEVIMLMINHCAARLRRRYGERRLPTMHMVEKEAFHWARLEIFTAAQAEEHIARSERMEAEIERVRRVLQIADRAPTPTERKYMESWLAMGYDSEALALAYDRTVVSTNKLSWAYMDKIVRSWYEKGLFTPQEIEKGDARPGNRRSAPAQSPAPAAAKPGKGDDAGRLAKLLNIKE